MMLLKDIWQSFLNMPAWVSLWVFGVLVPMNTGILFFTGEPYAMPIALLAFGGFLPNFVLLAVDRAFSARMAIPHIIGWLPLLPLLIYLLLKHTDALSPNYQAYLWGLLLCNSVSLVMDFPDAWRVARGRGRAY